MNKPTLSNWQFWACAAALIAAAFVYAAFLPDLLEWVNGAPLPGSTP